MNRVTMRMFVLLFSATALHAQSRVPVDPLSAGVASLLESRTTVQLMSPTRHAAILRARGLGSWQTPGLRTILPSSMHGPHPLHLFSPDLIPLELLDADSLTLISGPTLSHFIPSPSGALIVHHKAIPESVSAEAVLFAGSETGDPVIQRFTRTNLPLRNRQKVGESGSFAIAGGVGAWLARLQAVSLAHFSTGYERTDPLIAEYSADLSTDHNAARYIGLELERTLSGGTTINGGIQYHRTGGWDMLGFFPTFVHYAHDDLTFSAMYAGEHPRTSMQISHASSTFTLSPLVSAPEASFVSGRSSVRADVVAFQSTSLAIPVSIQFAWTAVTQPVDESHRQSLFIDDFSTWSAGAQANAEVELGMIRSNLSVRLDRNINGERSLSFEASAGSPVWEHGEIELAAHRVARPSRVEELFGRYFVTRMLPQRAVADTFVVQGDASLLTEIVSSVELSLTGSTGVLSGSARIFLQRQDAPVQFVTTRVVQSPLQSDVVLAGAFRNAADRTALGFEAEADHSSKSMSGRVTYAYFDNTRVTDHPRHTFLLSATADIASGLSFGVSARGTSKTVWPTFRVAAMDNYLNGAQMRGDIPEYWLLNFQVTQRLERLFFLGAIDIRIEVMNVLNRRYKLLPFGAELSAAGFGFVYVRL